MTMPADIRKLAQEAVELSSGESLSWDALDCEFPGDVVITYPDGHTETFYAWEHARFIAHAGTHYATLARALIEALDERDEARRRFHARDAEADRLAQRISRAFDEVNAPAMGAEPHERIQMLAGERDEERRAHSVTIARRDEARRNYQFMVDRAADEKLDGYRELGAHAAAAENDRDKLLAALPHALGSCKCERQEWDETRQLPPWPEEHEAAREWLRGRIE